jgi:hypothetical protein
MRLDVYASDSLVARLIKLLAIAMVTIMLHSSPCMALYAPPAFYQLAAGSDLVVLGRIVALDDSTFTLAVDDLLVGTSSDTLLRVARFEDWTCSSRWLPYAVGQREIAFLCRSGPGYRTNSAGAEGEWQIRGDKVTCAYFPSTFALPSVKSLDTVLPLKLVVSALKDFGACVRIDTEWLPARKEGNMGFPPSYKETVVVLCDSTTIDHLANRSKVHKYLVDTWRTPKERAFGDGIPCGRYR